MAIVIMALAILPMVSMFDAGLRASVAGSNYDKARALAGEQLEEIRALPYEEAVSRHTPGPVVTQERGIFTYRIATSHMSLTPSGLTEDSGSRNMMKVEVTVTWDGGKSYSTSGLTSRGGE